MFNTKILLTAALVTAGIVGGVFFGWSFLGGDEPRETPTETREINSSMQRDQGEPYEALKDRLAKDSDKWKSILEEEPAAIELDIDHIELGDQYLVVGNVDSAYKQYMKATNDYLDDLPASLLLRLAITTEQLGDDQNANRHFQNVVRSAPDKSLIRLLGLTGVARTWQNEGLFADAHEVLGEMILIYLSNEDLHEEVRFQIACQLSNLIQVKCLASLPASRSMDSIEFDLPGPNLDAMVEILQTFSDFQLEHDPETTEKILVEALQRPSEDVNMIAIRAKADLTPIEVILAEITTKTRIQFELSQLAKDTINNRSLRLNIAGLPVSSILDFLFNPLGLVWEQKGESIFVFADTEPGVDRQTYLFGCADRMFRTIELELPEDVRRNSSVLHRGNLRYLTGDKQLASEYYRKLEKLLPNNELAAKLSFNMAMAEIQNGEIAAARKRLFFTVDQSLSHRLQAKSYAWLGRIEMQVGRSDRAVYALSRGLALAEDSQIKQDVVLSLAKAHLLENDPFSANRVLFNHVSEITEDLKKKKASVFAAYARFLGTVPGEGLRNEGERMIVALAGISIKDTSEFIERLLIGRAFSEVGFQDRASEFLELALDTAPSELWRRRVAYELATNHFRAGEIAEATAHYESLTTGESDEASLLAQMQLARIALATEKYDDCILICRNIWKQEISNDQKMETLSMMGQAFQQKGKYRTAVDCFAGVFPDASEDSSTQPGPPSSVN